MGSAGLGLLLRSSHRHFVISIVGLTAICVFHYYISGAVHLQALNGDMLDVPYRHDLLIIMRRETNHMTMYVLVF